MVSIVPYSTMYYSFRLFLSSYSNVRQIVLTRTCNVATTRIPRNEHYTKRHSRSGLESCAIKLRSRIFLVRSCANIKLYKYYCRGKESVQTQIYMQLCFKNCELHIYINKNYVDCYIL